MTVSAAILSRPTLVATHVLNFRTPNSNRFLGPRLLFNHRKTSCSKDRVCQCPNSMNEPIRIRAGNGADEGVQGLEQGAFVNGSSNFAANGLEATVNNLVGVCVCVFFP